MSIFDKFRQISKQDDTPAGPVEYIIAGLGNPGEKYEGTRHNAGFIVMDALAEKLGFEMKKLKFKSLCADVSVSGKHCLVMKPSTFMNNSGQAISEAMNYYKLDIEHVVIVYDDISLEPGKLRIRRKGSDGGHNGIKNIIYLSGSDKFPRIKVGVGAKPNPHWELADWVLSRFTESEMKSLTEAAENAAQSVEYMVNEQTDKAMNLFNS